ncbi:MAG TPA: potassium channel family protein [Myxococcota bacterium]
MYHSAVNFTSLGYGDVVMDQEWKLLGPLEAANGVLMMSMTAAALTAILQNVIRSQMDGIVAGRQRSRDSDN